MFKIEIKDIEQLPKVAQKFIEKINESKTNCFAFYGEMGAGKTTFIKALCKELGVLQTVNSPSFSIINEYETTTDKTIFHFDFYRIKEMEEALDFGCEDYFYSQNLCLIEWPQKIEPLLPENYTKVYIKELIDGSRVLEIKNQ